MGLKNAAFTACLAISVFATAAPAYASGPGSTPAPRPAEKAKVSHPNRVASRSTTSVLAAKLAKTPIKTREAFTSRPVMKLESHDGKSPLRGVAAKDYKEAIPEKVFKLAQGADKAVPTLVRVVKLDEGTAYWFEKEGKIAPTGIFENAGGDVSAIDLKTTLGWGR